MRVWIASSKRWGESTEVVWRVTWWGTPKARGDAEPQPDDAPEFTNDHKDRASAMREAKKVAANPDNYWETARVQKLWLERLDHETYDWVPVGEFEDVGATV